MSQRRQSEPKQVRDILDLSAVPRTGLAVLDISGGPGLVAKSMKIEGNDVIVTELSPIATRAMSGSSGESIVSVCLQQRQT